MTYNYRCRTAGAAPCSYHTETDDERDLRGRIERHLIEVHHVQPPTKTIVDYLVVTAREGAPAFLR